MDYFMSLVGKDQETITQAIKDLAENFEKVKLQENKIENLDAENDALKEEVYDLRNKLKYEREMNNELGEDIKRKELEIEHMEKYMSNKVNLEKAPKEKAEEVDNLRDKCESLSNQAGK